MFEAITIHRRQHPNLKQPFSIGHLAECLLFYDKVNIIISPTELELLIKKCDISKILNLVESEKLNIRIKHNVFGSSGTPNTSRFGYSTFSLVNQDLETTVYKTFHNVYHNSIKSHVGKDLLMPHLSIYNYDLKILDGFVSNADYITKTFKQAIRRSFAEYPIPLDTKFEIRTDLPRYENEKMFEKVYQVDTDFDLAKFEGQLNEKDGIKSNTGFPTSYMMELSGAIFDINVAANFDTEISSEEVSSDIIKESIDFVQTIKYNSENKIWFFDNFCG